MKLFRLAFAFIFFSSYYVYAQEPTDCTNAIIVCGNSNIVSDANGIGIQELNGNNTCGSQENNSLWLKLNIVTSGTLGFTLTPQTTSINEDYDFFVFGPDVNCGNLGQAIRCSTTNPAAANQGNNLTGMNGTETDTSEGPGPNGNSFVSWLNVNAGESYFIVIDRWAGSNSFNLEWTGSAEFAEPPANQVTSGAALNLEECDVVAPFDDGFTEFDLTVNTASIIGSQNDVVVSYHTSESDAIININPVTSPFTNSSNPQTIYVRLTNTITECFDVSEFQLDVSLGPDFAVPTDFETCDDYNDGDATNGQTIFDLASKNAELLNGQNPLDINISYHLSLADAEASANALPNLYYNTTPFIQQIFVRLESSINTNCQSFTSFNLIVNQLPTYSNASLFQCDEDGLTDGFTLFNLTEAFDFMSNSLPQRSGKYYTSLIDAQNDNNEIDGTSYNNTANPQTIYVRIINDITSCYDIAELILEVSTTTANNAALFECDDDGVEDGFYEFDLSQADITVLSGTPAGVTLNYYATYEDALLEQNALPNNHTNLVPYNDTIYARVEDDNACYGINEVQLTVYKLPDIETEFETMYCLNFFPDTITLNAGLVSGNPNDFTYAWSTGENTYEIDVNAAATYSVTVTNTNGCSKDRTIVVLPSNIATIDDVEVVDATSNNIITILVSGEGDYEYALNDINGPYQDSNVFENVPPGLHTVYVRDKNNCGIVEDIVSVIGFPKFLTPNGDGYHDTWQVYGINHSSQLESTIHIFNRYGKLIKQLSPTSIGWDGTFNGQPLPSSDYWFHVKLQDGRVFKSHFTLKR
ncbi:MAG: T9SS type B sorting domain-containing protein [Flavobacteriaceae bacterium]